MLKQKKRMFRNDSYWNSMNELKALLIFKKLHALNFPRGMQIELCKVMEADTNLSSGSISAKVCNYKSIAGINKPSHASTATKETYSRYKKISISDLEKNIECMKLDEFNEH